MSTAGAGAGSGSGSGTREARHDALEARAILLSRSAALETALEKAVADRNKALATMLQLKNELIDLGALGEQSEPHSPAGKLSLKLKNAKFLVGVLDQRVEQCVSALQLHNRRLDDVQSEINAMRAQGAGAGEGAGPGAGMGAGAGDAGHAAPPTWVQALVGAQEFQQTIAMDNSFQKLPLLQLCWYEPLAAELVKRHYTGDRGHGRISAVIGSPGTGKSMSRNFIAKHILKHTKGPVAIVFTATPVVNQSPVVVLTRSDTDAPLEARVLEDMSAAKVRVMLGRYLNDGTTWCLADVSHGELKHAVAMRHIVYFTSNNTALTKRLHEIGKLPRGKVALWYVPKVQLQEGIAWYKLVANKRTVSTKKKRQLELWLIKYGFSLRVLSNLVDAEDSKACEMGMAAELVAKLRSAKISLRRLAEDPDVHLEHVGGDAALCIRSAFSTTKPSFAYAGVEWRSKWVKEQVFLWAWAEASYHATALVSRYNTALTSDVRGRLFEDFMLAQFRVHLSAEGMLFTFQTTLNMGAATEDSVGLITDNDDVPTPISRQVIASNCRWFRDSGKWDDSDACLEREVVQRVMQRGDGSPVLLIPFNQDYPGLDAVLVWKQGGVWKALLIQVTLSPRHAASGGGEVVFACWVQWLKDNGVQSTNIGVLYCVKPEDHPYSWQPVGGLAVAQYSMSWTTGRHKSKGSGKRTTATAHRGIAQRLRAGGNRSRLLCRFTNAELLTFAAANQLPIKGSRLTKAAIIAAIVESADKKDPTPASARSVVPRRCKRARKKK